MISDAVTMQILVCQREREGSLYYLRVILGGQIVSVLAIGPSIRGFHPGRGR
jgi:hypothetical protein